MCPSNQTFLLLLVRRGYANYNAQGAFMIIFFINCTAQKIMFSIKDFFNFCAVLRSSQLPQKRIWHIQQSIIVITSSKSFSKFPSVLAILEKVDAELLGPPLKFQLNIVFQLHGACVSRLSFRFL